MAGYDIEGFEAWLRKRYNPTTAASWMKVLRTADERNTPWETLREMDSSDLFIYLNNRSAGNTRHEKAKHSALSAYAQYLDQKRRGVVK